MAIQAPLYPNNFGFPLCGSQDWIVENGFGITHSCLNPQQKHAQQQLQEQEQQFEQQRRGMQQRNQNMFLNSGSLDLQFEMHSREIDNYIKLQNEKLRTTLHEQRKLQITTLLKKVELEALFLLRQKDEEIVQAAKKRIELEEFLIKLEAENEAWRRVAQEKEAMVVSLNNTIEEMREQAYYSFNNDAESCCDESRGNYKDMEEENGKGSSGEEEEEEEIMRKMMICKSCNSGISCYLFLPCRHLCSCKACEASLKACPVCKIPKKASIETLIF